MSYNFRFFVDPYVLMRIDRPLLVKLFERLGQLQPEKARLPNPVGNDGYFDALAWTIERGEGLPERMLEALAEIEGLAVGDHGPYERLDDGTDADGSSARMRRAIESWLARGVQARAALPEPAGPSWRVEKAPALDGTPEVSSKACFENRACSGNGREEGEISSGFRSDQSLLASAATVSKQASSPEMEQPPVADFTRLARLTALEYERVRKAEAKRLHLRLGTLDAEVERARPLEYDTQANGIVLPKVEPWRPSPPP